MVDTSHGKAGTSGCWARGCWSSGQNGAGIGGQAQLKGHLFQQSSEGLRRMENALSCLPSSIQVRAILGGISCLGLPSARMEHGHQGNLAGSLWSQL